MALFRTFVNTSLQPTPHMFRQTGTGGTEVTTVIPNNATVILTDDAPQKVLETDAGNPILFDQ